MKIMFSLALTIVCTIACAQTNNEMEYSKLTKRQLNLAAYAALEAQGNMEALDIAVRMALDEGVTINELKEAFSQLYAYTGFPRSLNALNQLKRILNDRQTEGIIDNEGRPWQRPTTWDDAKEALKRGTEVQTRLCGGTPYDYVFCPQDDYYLKSHLFGDIFAGDILSESDREIVTVAALSGMKGVESQLESHKRAAVTMGNTKEQVDELCRFLSENNMSISDNAAEMHDGYWKKGLPNTAYEKYFTGKSYLTTITPKNMTDGEKTAQPYSNVTFEPGCRNNWHIHHGAHQILICVSGKGWYQEWGKPAIPLKAGDIIDIPEGVKHWHGAQANSWFQHIATHVKTGDKESNEWLEAVEDEQYNKLKP